MAGELDVACVAQLARLQLTAEETELFQKQLGDVLKYAEKLKEVNVAVSSGSSVPGLRRRMRSRFSTFFVQMNLAIGSLPPKP